MPKLPARLTLPKVRVKHNFLKHENNYKLGLNMSKDPIDIDKLFKKALENAPMTPPPGAFFAIKSQLPSLASTAGIGAKAAVSMKMFGVIASTLIIAGTAVYYLMDTGAESPIASHAKEAPLVPSVEQPSKPITPLLSGEAQPNAGGLKPRNATVGNKNSEALNKIENPQGLI